MVDVGVNDVVVRPETRLDEAALLVVVVVLMVVRLPLPISFAFNAKVIVGVSGQARGAVPGLDNCLCQLYTCRYSYTLHFRCGDGPVGLYIGLNGSVSV